MADSARTATYTVTVDGIGPVPVHILERTPAGAGQVALRLIEGKSGRFSHKRCGAPCDTWMREPDSGW
jgi:hypothetical protein